MKFLTSVLAIGVLFGTVTDARSAILEATSTRPDLFNDFRIAFNDTGDGLLQFSEIRSFSGVTFVPPTEPSVDVSIVMAVPDIAGISTVSGRVTASRSDRWQFANAADGSGALEIARGSWTYEIVPVPLPAGATLLLGGLAALGVAARRRAAG